MTMMMRNQYNEIRFSEQGELVGFLNLAAGREMMNPHLLWRLILDDGECLEIEARASGKVICSEMPSEVRFQTRAVRTEFGQELPIGVCVSVKILPGSVAWQIEVKNNAEGVTVRECQFPVFSVRNPEPPMEVCTSRLISERIVDLPARLRESFSFYMAPDNKYLRKDELAFYPGRTCSMNFYLLQWEKDGFYFGCHDEEFGMTLHAFEKEKDSVNVFMTRFPFLKAGRSWKSPAFVTTSYPGDFSAGAAIYRKWADSWFVPPEVPAQIRRSQGWQRIILKHQYGEYFFRYDDLEAAYENGKKAGLDTLFLFGWTSEGMDAGYPAYTPDAAQGGKEALRRSILNVRTRGGHVILYFNGQLIDAASDYYKSGAGQRVSIKREDGTEHREYYNFSNTGSFCRAFINKTFVVACPSCREWIDFLKRHIDFAAEVGADSVFFDQLGLASYPCCDPAHGHEIPFTGLMKQKREMLRELYEYAHTEYPGMALGIECTTDQTAQYADFVHTCGNIAQVWNPGWRQLNEPPQVKADHNLYRSAFPELILSDRDVKDDSDDVIFRVNQMLLLGMITDAAVFRCRATIASAPFYQEYLGRANAIRERHRAVLLEGEFSAAGHHSVSEPGIQTSSFRHENELAILLTQSWKDKLTTVVSVPGYVFLTCESIRGDASVTADGTVSLPRDSFAFLFYEKSEA